MRLGINRNVWAMGWTSLLNDASSELLYPVLPLFLTITLGAPASAVGAVEGAADAAAQVVGLAVGRRSDRIRKRMPFVWSGYTMSNLAKPLVAAAPAWGWVLGARVLDRAGKGVRTAPRDALLRDSSEPGRAGHVFGFHRFMDSLGAVIGPLVALALLEAGLSYRQVIMVAVAPALLTMLALRRIRDIPAAPADAAEPVERARLADLGRPFWAFTAAWTVFSLGNSADVFLLLRAKDLGLGATAVVLAYALYNTLYSGLSWPLGTLSDRIGKRRVLAAGLAVFAAVYAGFGLARTGALVWPLMAVYGVYIAATDGVGKALVSDLSPPRHRATGQGAFRLATGTAAVVASLVAGVLWQAVGPGAVFALGAVAALLALVALAAVRPRDQPVG
ncbi:MAG TPA: MFS transporter [Gaiellales bacterium]